MGLLEHCWLLRFLSAPSCAGAHLISPYWFTGWRIVMPPPVPQCPFRLGRDHLVTAGKKSSLLSLMWQWTARQHCEFSCEQQGSWLLVATMHTLWLLSPGFLFVCLFFPSELFKTTQNYMWGLYRARWSVPWLCLSARCQAPFCLHPAFVIFPPPFFLPFLPLLSL